MSHLHPTVSRRRVLWLAGGLAGGVALHGCTRSADSTSSAAPGKPLTSGVNPWPGYSGHYVALKKGLFQQEGVNVQETFFQSAGDSITGFLAGKVDISWGTSGDAIEMINKDPSIRMIYVVDYSNGSDGIIGRDINSPADLKGKTIGRENLLFENVLLRAYLEKGGLTEADVMLKDMTAADAATAFAAKRVDAAVSYEPWLSKAAQQGGGKVIFSTKDTNLIADVIVTRQQVIETRKADLQAYLRAVDKAVKLVNAGDPEAIQIVAEKLGVSVEEAKTQIAGVKIFDLAENKSLGFNTSNPKNVLKNFELNVKAAHDTKLIPKVLETDALYDDSIVKSL
jgi:NitT/TauT family transport system substrate-binding protein